MIHGLVTTFKVRPDADVGLILIGDDSGRPRDRLGDLRLQALAGDILNGQAACLAVALNQNHYGLFCRTTSPLADSAIAGLPANLGFITFDNTLKHPGHWF